MSFLIERYFPVDRKEKLEKEIQELEIQLKDREDALPAHSIRPHQLLLIEELETAIEDKKKELDELRKGG